MTSENFAYWLQGFFEIRGTNEGLTTEQAQIIQNHLNMVFVHEIDPKLTPDPEKQAELRVLHDHLRPPRNTNLIMKC